MTVRGLKRPDLLRGVQTSAKYAVSAKKGYHRSQCSFATSESCVLMEVIVRDVRLKLYPGKQHTLEFDSKVTPSCPRLHVRNQSSKNLLPAQICVPSDSSMLLENPVTVGKWLRYYIRTLALTVSISCYDGTPRNARHQARAYLTPADFDARFI